MCLWNCVDYRQQEQEMNGAVVTIEATKEKLTFGGSALFQNSLYVTTVISLYQKTIAKWCG
jgi:hypothetical protein